MRFSKKDTRVMSLLKKMMGDRNSRSQALAAAKDLSAREMQMLVAVMTADRKTSERTARSRQAGA